MDWLATSRGHPIDQIINLTAASLPVLAVGGASYATACSSPSSTCIPSSSTPMPGCPASGSAGCSSLPCSITGITPRTRRLMTATSAPSSRSGNRLFHTALVDARYPTAYGLGDGRLDVQDYLGQLVTPLLPGSLSGR